MKTKAELRKIFKAKRAELFEVDIQVMSVQIKEQVRSFCEQKPELNHFHLFLPIEKLREINTYYIKEYLEEAHKSIYTSQINPDSNEMEIHKIDQFTTYELDHFGIPNPVSSVLGAGEELQVVFLPLLAVDQFGNRVGYGKGYYDRFLSKLKSEVIKVGLSFFEPISEIPSEAFDIKCDYCITPNNIINFCE